MPDKLGLAENKNSMKIKNKKYTEWLLVILLVMTGFFVRYASIENIPSGIYPDEAVNGMNAYDAKQSGEYQWFYVDNNGREGLYINLQSTSIALFGNNLLGLKFWSIIFGTLAVLGTFLLSKEAFRSTRAGLISGFLTAFSFWSINFSRIAFRAIMMPAILAFSFYFLIRGFRTKKYVHFILSGLIFGLGFHTYIAFRIAPAIIIVLLFFMLITKKHFIRDYWKQLLIFGVSVFITLLPILYTFYQHPEYLSSRSASVSVLSPEVNEGEPVKELSRSLFLSLAKYNFWGDQNWRHNYPPYPILDPITGVAFLIGIIYVASKSLHLIYLRFRHDVHDRKLYIYFMFLAWFIVMLAPEFLTAEGLPHALRAIGTTPVVMIFATIPFLWILGKAEENSKGFRITVLSLITACLIFVGLFNTIKYFVFFGNNPKQAGSFNENLKEIAYYAREIPQSTETFIIAENMERIPIKFLNPGLENIKYIYSSQLDSINPKSDDFIILMTDPRDEFYQDLKKRFPELGIFQHNTKHKSTFIELKNK